MPKVPGVQIGTVSKLHFESLEKKCHSDVGAVERHREYYMGEGGGFPRVWAVVSQVSARLPVACPKVPFRCGCGREAQRILYGGRWWLPLSPGCGASSECKVARGLSQSAIRMWVRWRGTENTIWGKVVASLESGLW
jgi:hypothetical protein